MDFCGAVTEECDVIGIRQVGEVKIFPHPDTLRTSKGAFKDEVDSVVKQCRQIYTCVNNLEEVPVEACVNCIVNVR